MIVCIILSTVYIIVYQENIVTFILIYFDFALLYSACYK